jgi:hypothetical protein
LVESPGRLKTKETSLWDRGGDLGHEGHVVEGVTRDGGQGGGGETNIPSMVNKNPIEADKSRSGSHIRPSVLAVAEGKLDEPKGVNRVVKKLSLRGGEVGIVPLRRVAGKVKITGNDPRDLITGIVGREALKELRFSSRLTGGVNIGETKTTVVAVDGEIYGENMARGGSVD